MKPILITLLVFTSACLGPDDLWDTWERLEGSQREDIDRERSSDALPQGQTQDASKWVLIENETDYGTDIFTYNDDLELAAQSDTSICRCMTGILHSETSFDYGEDHFEQTTTHEEGSTTLRLNYGEGGQIISSHREGWSSNAVEYYVYDRNSQLLEISGRAFTEYVERNRKGQILRYNARRNSNGEVQATQYAYNGEGLRIESLSFYGTRATFGYDERGRMIEHHSEGNFSSIDEVFEYDDANLLKRHGVRSSDTVSMTEYAYDAHQRLVRKEVIQSSDAGATFGPLQESLYTYDDEGFPLLFQSFTGGVLAAQIEYANTRLNDGILEVVRTDLEGEQRRSLYRELEGAPTLPPAIPEFDRDDPIPKAPTMLMNFGSGRL